MEVSPHIRGFSPYHHLDLEIYGGIKALTMDVDNAGSSEIVV